MADESRASSKSKNNKALLAEESRVLSKLKKKALLEAPNSSSHDEETLIPILNLDIIFIILTFLPTESVLRMKSVCRAWADIIDGSSFILTHILQPAPISGFFSGFFSETFKSVPTNPKFPDMITTFISQGFRAESMSHGLICFNRHKDGVIIIANPVTFHWFRLPLWHSNSDSDSLTFTHSRMLIYDPKVSFHFKVIITTCEIFPPHYDYALWFHIYSSKTNSWKLSSRLNVNIDFDDIVNFNDILNWSCIGGGSICWVEKIDSNLYLNGYEIDRDICWMTPLPCLRDENDEIYFDHTEIMSQNGELYCAIFDSEKNRVVVQRIEDGMNWVLEGEADTKELSYSL